MNSRERVITALNHEEPDRVPIDLGGTVISTIAISTYAALRRRLGLVEQPIQTLELVQQVARVDEDMMDRLGVDVAPVFANDPDAPGSGIITAPDGTESIQDDFGATLKKFAGCHYFDWQEFPLPEPSLEALEKMPWPDPADPGRYRGLRDRVKSLREGTNRALVGMAPCGHDLFNQLFRVRGMENGLMDLLTEEEFVCAFLDRLCDTICTAQTLFLTEVGDLIDVQFAADDLAGQTGPLVAPDLWRRLIKPRQARILATIKAHTRAPVLYHTCGAVTEFLDDLIEIGVDILNPVQVSATGMDTAQLKKRFGKRLSFWGGGCDTQNVLNRGTPDQVRAEVRRRIRDLAPGGGFVFNPVHNIQAGVPVENIIAMFDTAREAGRYPVRCA
ncbi:MAG: uroporphyrinogen decarboxylase family protein [bacterium]